MAKKKKKRVFKIKNIIILLIIIVILIALFYYVLNLSIKNVYISGNNIVSENEIMTISNLENYPSFLLTKSPDIKKKIKNNSYIKTVNINKKWGNIIELEIIEHQAIALTLDKILLSNGKEVENTYTLMDVPILIKKPENPDIYKHFAEKFSNLNPNILRQISEIEYSPVNVDEERFLLYMNDGNLVYITLTKINKLNKYNNIKDKLKELKGIIYLDSGDYVEVKNY